MSVIDERKAPAAGGERQPPRLQNSETIDLKPPQYFLWKPWFDFVLAALLAVPGAVIIGLLIVVVRLSSRGPGLFRQVRVGRDGRTFTMYKIRTMRSDAEAKCGPTWCTVGDPRITRLGFVLRKLHLDELPQLFNVLRGEMSLIGPRPERPEFVEVLAEVIPGYRDRLAVLPGVTGLAQINLPPDTDLNSVRRKLALDLEYIQMAGPLLDARMILCTFVRMLGLPGETVMGLFGLRRPVPEVLENDGELSIGALLYSRTRPAEAAAASANVHHETADDTARSGRARRGRPLERVPRDPVNRPR